jgi:phosphatidate cytidylyltransferase
LTWICITAVLTDIGGFFIGKLIRGKPFKSVSPNKTWAGVIGGWIFSLSGSLILFHYFYKLEITLIHIITATFLMSVSSQIGDLFESYLKRKSNKKDSSNLIPRHGGVLDRNDSLIGATLFFIALSYYY